MNLSCPGKDMLGLRSLAGQVGGTTKRDKVSGTHSGAEGPLSPAQPSLGWGAPKAPLLLQRGVPVLQDPTRLMGRDPPWATEEVDLVPQQQALAMKPLPAPFTDFAQIKDPEVSSQWSAQPDPDPVLMEGHWVWASWVSWVQGSRP